MISLCANVVVMWHVRFAVIFQSVTTYTNFQVVTFSTLCTKSL